MVVMKFGGTSVADAAAIGRAVRLVMAQSRPVVVVSALGGVTDALVSIANLAASGALDLALRKLDDLHARHASVAATVGDPQSRSELLGTIREEFAALDSLVRASSILREVSPRSADAVLAFGELLSSRILAAALDAAGAPAVWMDARQLLVSDGEHTHAGVLMEETAARLARLVPPLIEQGRLPVMGGFIAATREGATTTLGRGGSDYSAAVVGACLNAREIQIWTDVDGMLTGDPRVLAAPRLVRHLSFDEASELAHFGAKVLHPATIRPAMARDVPVRILNSRRPESTGTLITAALPVRDEPLAAFACRRGMTIVDVRPRPRMKRHAFAGTVLAAFERHLIEVDLITTSDGGLSLALQEHRRLDAALAELAEAADLSRRPGMALICAVGEGLRQEPGLAARLLGVLSDVHLMMVSQASAGRSLTIVVPEPQLERALERLHASFFERPARRVPRDSRVAAPATAARDAVPQEQPL
jgi:aspartate kinase